jgi:hypothetical protein
MGAFIYVELVEAEKYLSSSPGTKPPPGVFPWAAARSSDPSVLRRVTLCPGSGVSTLPVMVYAFRALMPGSATLTARSRKPGSGSSRHDVAACTLIVGSGSWAAQHTQAA